MTILLVGLLALAGSVAPADGGADPSAEALITAGHWKRARVLAEQLHEASPNDARADYLLSEVKEAFGDLDGALPLAEKAVELDPGNARYHFQLAQVCGETAEKASFFSKGGWAKRFKAEAEKAATLDPKNLDVRFALLEYDLQAPRLMGGGQDKALAMAEEIAKIEPAHGYLAQVRLAEERKNTAAEEAWYEKAVAVAPGDYEVLVAAAEFYTGQTEMKLNPAEKYGREALKVDGGRVEAYSVLARVYAAGQRWSDLDRTLISSETNVPDDLNPYYQAGRQLLVEGRELDRAERYLRKYLTREPEAGAPSLAHAHWRLGLVLEKEGHRHGAVSELETAVRLKPDLAEAKKDLKRQQ